MTKAIARPSILDDVPTLCAMQARIIRIGGTTAHEVPYSNARFAEHYLTGPNVISCHTAVLDGRPIGFQVMGAYSALPEGWADLGTFVDPEVQRAGAGHVLFEATLAVARAAGIKVLNATIRADNTAGLGYYSGLGFTDYKSEPNYALTTGQVVGRVHKRLDL